VPVIAIAIIGVNTLAIHILLANERIDERRLIAVASGNFPTSLSGVLLPL
jgi:hypothetical protein